MANSKIEDKILGKVMRELRLEKGLTQEGLGYDSELTRVYISMVELGQNSLTLGSMLRIANSLDISLTEFIGKFEAEYKKQLGS